MLFRARAYFVFATLLFAACSPPGQKAEKPLVSATENYGIKYAKRFSIAERDSCTMVFLFGDRNNPDTTDVFVISKPGFHPKQMPSGAFYLNGPCKRLAALSSIYASIFYELQNLNNLVAIDNIDYIINPEIRTRFETKQLRELAKTPQVDIEQTVALKPDIIFTFGMGLGDRDKDKKLFQTGIPVAISVDHLEETPLARAEWIKFFAAFVDKKQLADSIFDCVEKNYQELKALAAGTKTRPTVFTETKYGDFWYMPGGKSYAAQLMKDAGATYLWKDNENFGSLPLSFEQVYTKAKDADFWLNLSIVKTKEQLLAGETRYAEFSAFKKGNLYNNTKVTNAKGYSTYWESGMIFPDRILNDLTLIFHPELRGRLKKGLYYYEQLP